MEKLCQKYEETLKKRKRIVSITTVNNNSLSLSLSLCLSRSLCSCRESIQSILEKKPSSTNEGSKGMAADVSGLVGAKKRVRKKRLWDSCKNFTTLEPHCQKLPRVLGGLLQWYSPGEALVRLLKRRSQASSRRSISHFYTQRAYSPAIQLEFILKPPKTERIFNATRDGNFFPGVESSRRAYIKK